MKVKSIKVNDWKCREQEIREKNVKWFEWFEELSTLPFYVTKLSIIQHNLVWDICFKFCWHVEVKAFGHLQFVSCITRGPNCHAYIK